MKHTFTGHADVCSCGQDTVVDQRSSQIVCASLTEWIPGTGNCVKRNPEFAAMSFEELEDLFHDTEWDTEEGHEKQNKIATEIVARGIAGWKIDNTPFRKGD